MRELSLFELGTLLLTTGLAGFTLVRDIDLYPAQADPSLEPDVQGYIEQLDYVDGRRNPGWRLLRESGVMVLTGRSAASCNLTFDGANRGCDGFWLLADGWHRFEQIQATRILPRANS